MKRQESQVCTAIDIGSNTLRMVVARCADSGLAILDSDEALVRIGASVNATGAISDEKTQLTISVLQRFLSLAARYSSQVTLAIATEAIRKATNKDAFLAAIHDATGIVVHCIGGDVESILTFYGASYALDEQKAKKQIAVMDLGGGSTELILAQNRQIRWHTSLPIGSGWLHDRYLTADPPRYEDNETASIFLHTYLRGLGLKNLPSLLYATGGSANTLFLLAQRAFDFSSQTTSGDVRDTLSYADLVRCEGLLWALSAQEVSDRYQIDRQRAPILAAGVLILRAFVEVFGLKEIHVTTNGIREGVALAYARYGDGWLAQVQQAANPASPAQGQQAATEESPLAGLYEEPFIEAGLRMFRERAKTMLDWREPVLENTDVEAVHKMRVASRRLRAAMDAYQEVADPRIFKPIYKRVKKTADVLGAARDTDVMIEHLREQLPQYSAQEQPGLQWLIAKLETYRQDHQKALVKHLQSLDEDAMLQDLAVCLRRGR